MVKARGKKSNVSRSRSVKKPTKKKASKKRYMRQHATPVSIQAEQRPETLNKPIFKNYLLDTAKNLDALFTSQKDGRLLTPTNEKLSFSSMQRRDDSITVGFRNRENAEKMRDAITSLGGETSQNIEKDKYGNHEVTLHPSGYFKQQKQQERAQQIEKAIQDVVSSYPEAQQKLLQRRVNYWQVLLNENNKGVTAISGDTGSTITIDASLISDKMRNDEKDMLSSKSIAVSVSGKDILISSKPQERSYIKEKGPEAEAAPVQTSPKVIDKEEEFISGLRREDESNKAIVANVQDTLSSLSEKKKKK